MSNFYYQESWLEILKEQEWKVRPKGAWEKVKAARKVERPQAFPLVNIIQTILFARQERDFLLRPASA